MESIDKLREYVDRQRDEYNNHNVSFVWQLSTIADEIEAEIAANYIRLPCDADGIPWTLETESFVDETGVEVVFSGLRVDRRGRWKILSNCVWYDPSLSRHVKPRTLKDVLREFANEAEWEQSPDSYEEIERKLITIYAAEIRELLGGDAE